MKNLTRTFITVVIALSMVSPSAFAVPPVSSGPYTITASVDGTLSMTAVIKKNDSTGATITTMDFGKLVDVGTGTLRSSPTSTTGTGAAVAFITANSHGLPYTVTQTGTAPSNGSVTLPSGACTVVPVITTADNGGAPIVGTIGTKGTWVATDKVLYTSDVSGSLRTIQAIYSVTDDSAAGATEGVPLSQQGGTYTGSVTFTVTA